MVLDLCSITQNGRKSYSFMSQAVGLMADCDLGTEHLRWMGGQRFMYGFLRGREYPVPFHLNRRGLSDLNHRTNSVVSFKPCPIELSILVSEDDKRRMVETHRALRSKHIASPSQLNVDETGEDDGEDLPPLKFADGPDDTWVTFEKPVLYA